MLSGNLTDKGIRVNDVAPVQCRHRSTRRKSRPRTSRNLARRPMKRPAQPEEIAPA
ncbi:hypothetical protein [Mesorhizobium sp. Root695]|uniref:hypothetical protein n=1 Tax=Mesorhizobium sp. Root695 TaxID=1736589 RepID=UPI00138F08FA